MYLYGRTILVHKTWKKNHFTPTSVKKIVSMNSQNNNHYVMNVTIYTNDQDRDHTRQPIQHNFHSCKITVSYTSAHTFDKESHTKLF